MDSGESATKEEERQRLPIAGVAPLGWELSLLPAYLAASFCAAAMAALIPRVFRIAFTRA